MKMGKENKVDTSDDFYNAVKTDFKLANDLDNGRKAMVEARTRYLPMEPGEKKKPKTYDVRLNRTDFYPGFSECLDDLTGAVFKKNIILEDATKEQQAHSENVDLQGNNLSVFSKSLFRNAEKYSITYFLVEHPVVPAGSSLHEERRIGARPYWREVTPPNLIYLFADIVNGQQTLMEIRIKETIITQEGFINAKTDQIRRYIQDLDENGQPFQVRWEVYKKKKDKDEYADEPENKGLLNPMKRIPLVPVYTKPSGFFRGKWRLEHCAWLNVIHWQSSSDQRNILRVVRCPILAHAGFFKKLDKDIEISPNTHQGTTNPDGKMWWVEHSGAAIDAGAKDLENLKHEMSQVGKNMAIKKTGSITATEAGINTAQSQSELQSDAKSLEDAIENGYILNGEWTSDSAPAPKVRTNTDFGLLESDAGNNTVLLKSCEAGKLSNRTYLTELKRRNQLAESVDIDDELELIRIEQATAWLGGDEDDEDKEIE